MIFDRIDGSKTNLPAQNPLGILRQSGLDITMNDNVATINFDEFGGNIMASRYREQFLQMRTQGMQRTVQSGSTIEVEVDPHSYLGNSTHMAAVVLGYAIASKDALGQVADGIMDQIATDNEAKKSQALPAVAGGSGFAMIPPAVITPEM